MHTSMRLPLPPCLAALSSRLQNTCCSRSGSPEMTSPYSARSLGILQGNALLTEELPVGVHRVLQFRLQIQWPPPDRVKRPSSRRENSQQLLHHIGQTAGLLHHDLHAALASAARRWTRLPAASSPQPLIAVSGVRSSWDTEEMNSDFICSLSPILQGHIVDVVHQLAHFVGVLVGYLHAVAAAGDTLGRL